MIIGARVYLSDGSYRKFECDNVFFDPHCGFLKLYRNGEAVTLFAHRSWSYVEINRDSTDT